MCPSMIGLLLWDHPVGVIVPYESYPARLSVGPTWVCSLTLAFYRMTSSNAVFDDWKDSRIGFS